MEMFLFSMFLAVVVLAAVLSGRQLRHSGNGRRGRRGGFWAHSRHADGGWDSGSSDSGGGWGGDSGGGGGGGGGGD